MAPQEDRPLARIGYPLTFPLMVVSGLLLTVEFTAARVATPTFMGIGVALGYLFDPERGRRRRALARDKVVSSLHAAGDAFETTKRDVTHRTQGVIADVRSRLSSNPVSDEVLVERVRAELGGPMSRPGAIVVSAAEGRVLLTGPVRADEVDRIVRRVARVRGVRGVENRLDPRAETSLGRPESRMRRGPARWEFSQARWSPTARLLAGVAGGTLGVAGLRRAVWSARC